MGGVTGKAAFVRVSILEPVIVAQFIINLARNIMSRSPILI